MFTSGSFLSDEKCIVMIIFTLFNFICYLFNVNKHLLNSPKISAHLLHVLTVHMGKGCQGGMGVGSV